MRLMPWYAITGMLSIVVIAAAAAVAEGGSQKSPGTCRGVLSSDFARQFAAEWIAAWNSHDLERILSHYTDDFEMLSPLIIERVGESSGSLRGKE